MIRAVLVLALLFPTLVGGEQARAEDNAVAAWAAEINGAFAPPSIEQVSTLITNAFGELPGACNTDGVAVRQIAPATADRAIMQTIAAGQMSNAWIVDAHFPQCGERSDKLMVVALMKDGKLRAGHLIDGQTLAWPSLISDTVRLVDVGLPPLLKKLVGGCNEPLGIPISRVVSRGADLKEAQNGVRYAGSWNEEWTYMVCAKSIVVPITFTADGQGGAYNRLRLSKAQTE